jgi:BirA family transcriptional regulator, biotin operon repressor / biotin---[acetyl-CoA-carboxylase] ligase
MKGPLEAQVHAQLAQGGFQSGAELARRLGVSRSAVWKAVVALRERGLIVHAVRNRGYRLAAPCEPLNAAKIRAGLHKGVRERIRDIETVWSLESTNAALLERSDLPPGLADVLLAEHQTAGRGRRGRAWLASPGGAICLSLAWCFQQMPRDLSALGLAVGVCALRALRRHVKEPIALKWPNDLTVGDRKLAGILIEMRAESAGPAYVVIGIGVNVALGEAVLARIAETGTRATDLKSAGADPVPRNALAAQLITEMVAGLTVFQSEGLRPFVVEWEAADGLRGRAVSVRAGERSARGIARGIDIGGALIVETPQGLQMFVSGDVSVRPEE